MVPAILTFLWVTKWISFKYSETHLEDITYLNQNEVEVPSDKHVFEFTILRDKVDAGEIDKNF
jgi:hypothetical protein